MKSHARVAVIGAGVVGCSALGPGTSSSTRLLEGSESRTYSNISDRLIPMTTIAVSPAASLVDSGDLSSAMSRTLPGTSSLISVLVARLSFGVVAASSRHPRDPGGDLT
jgi:hypothetical protein